MALSLGGWNGKPCTNYFNSTKVTVTSSNLSLVPQPLELASDPYTQESKVNFLTERKADHYTIAETCIQIWVRWYLK